jgi:peptidoglycan/LPS O-acetylase OafA/YrhL
MKYTFKFEDILMLIALIVSFIFTYNKTIALDHDYYFLNFIFFNVMFMSVSIFKLSKLLDKIMINKSVNNVVRYLAKLSFPIFLLHGMVIGGLSKCGVINIYTYDNLLFILSNTLIVYFISGLGGVILYDVFNIGRK